MTTRYAVSLIGTGYRLVQPEAFFDRKKDAVAYATEGLTRFGVFEVRVQRQNQVEYEVALFPTDELVVWVPDAQVFRKQRFLTPEEVEHNRRTAWAWQANA